MSEHEHKRKFEKRLNLEGYEECVAEKEDELKDAHRTLDVAHTMLYAADHRYKNALCSLHDSHAGLCDVIEWSDKITPEVRNTDI
jgi:hypothetical protein